MIAAFRDLLCDDALVVFVPTWNNGIGAELLVFSIVVLHMLELGYVAAQADAPPLILADGCAEAPSFTCMFEGSSSG